MASNVRNGIACLGVAAKLSSIMGKECLHVRRNRPMTAEERQNAEVILTKLGKYFIPRRNKIYERYVFNSRSQKADESFDQFLKHFAYSLPHVSSVRLKKKCSAIVSSLAYETMDTATAFFENLS